MLAASRQDEPRAPRSRGRHATNSPTATSWPGSAANRPRVKRRARYEFMAVRGPPRGPVLPAQQAHRTPTARYRSGYRARRAPCRPQPPGRTCRGHRRPATTWIGIGGHVSTSQRSSNRSSSWEAAWVPIIISSVARPSSGDGAGATRAAIISDRQPEPAGGERRRCRYARLSQLVAASARRQQERPRRQATAGAALRPRQRERQTAAWIARGRDPRAAVVGSRRSM